MFREWSITFDNESQAKNIQDYWAPAEHMGFNYIISQHNLDSRIFTDYLMYVNGDIFNAISKAGLSQEINEKIDEYINENREYSKCFDNRSCNIKILEDDNLQNRTARVIVGPLYHGKLKNSVLAYKVTVKLNGELRGNDYDFYNDQFFTIGSSEHCTVKIDNVEDVVYIVAVDSTYFRPKVGQEITTDYNYTLIEEGNKHILKKDGLSIEIIFKEAILEVSEDPNLSLVDAIKTSGIPDAHKFVTKGAVFTKRDNNKYHLMADGTISDKECDKNIGCFLPKDKTIRLRKLSGQMEDINLENVAYKLKYLGDEVFSYFNLPKPGHISENDWPYTGVLTPLAKSGDLLNDIPEVKNGEKETQVIVVAPSSRKVFHVLRGDIFILIRREFELEKGDVIFIDNKAYKFLG